MATLSLFSKASKCQVATAQVSYDWVYWVWEIEEIKFGVERVTQEKLYD